MSYRQVKVCAGIGDNIWLLQKLINAKERFAFELPDGKPQRGKQIFDLLPSVSASATYVPGLSYATVDENNIQKAYALFKDIPSSTKDFFLTCNKHLEDGKRIEEFFPDLDTSFRIDWKTDQYKLNVDTNFPDHTKYIGIYTSSYSTLRNWGFWNERKWFDLIHMINKLDKGYVFVIIGAMWDIDVVRKLVQLLSAHKIKFINTVGEPLGSVIEIMKRLHYFFSFPSGLGILAPTVGCPVTMYYPEHLKLMMNAWADPKDISSGLYKGCQFCEPHQSYGWCIENGKI